MKLTWRSDRILPLPQNLRHRTNIGPINESKGFIVIPEHNSPSMYPFDARQVSHTWAARIVSRHNLWLGATHKEDDGDISGAVLLYVKDALACIKSRNLPRAALSCSSAANCLEKTGKVKIAKALYAEAASIYEDYSNESLDRAIRESIWSLQRAYENYILAEDEEHTNDVYYRYASLTSKVSPVFGADALVDLLKFHEAAARQPTRELIKQSLPILKETLKIIRELMEFRNSQIRLSELDDAVSIEERTGCTKYS